MTTISVIIPTLNESAYLPKLLEALKHQSQKIDEIIVADAGSKDNTVEVAQIAGVQVVTGGTPGVGRNAGARIAKGDIFLFLDADVIPPPDFIKKSIAEFIDSKYVVATCLIEPIEKKLDDQIIMEITNLYMQIISPFSSRAPGFCIFVKNTVHKKIHGFDESLLLCEDHDFVKRAKRYGKFGYLSNIKIPVSMRRLEKEGLIQLAFKYVWTEMFALTGKPVRSMPFKYEFGAFDKNINSDQKILTNISDLRKKLGNFTNPVLLYSKKSLTKINHILELDLSQLSITQIKSIATAVNQDVLYQYIHKRVSLVSKSKPVRYSLQKLKTLPKECIRILNTRILS